MLLINEWLPNPAGADAEGEWIELWNNGASAVNLKGWVLKAGSAKKQYVLKEEIVPPGGYALVRRGESRLSLKNSDGAITLYDSAGAKRDALSFVGSAPEGMSANSAPSGGETGRGAFFAEPTPGAANAVRKLPQALASASVADAVPAAPSATPLSVFALATAVALVIAYAVVLTIKKDETLSKLFFG